MSWLLHVLIAAVLGGAAFLLVAAIVPGFRVRGGIGIAIGIAMVYGLIKALLQGVLILFTFPLVLVTFGLFIVVINAFFLWITDRLVRRFQVNGFGSLLFGSVLLSLIDIAMELVIRGGAIY